MHHVPGINEFKPILHVIVDRTQTLSQANAIRSVAQSLHHIFKDDYNVIVTMKEVEIIADNTTVVNVTLDETTDYEKFIEYLQKIPKSIKKVEEADMTDVG